MNEITEDYVSYDVAKLLREKGFNISLDSKNWICCMYDENGDIHWGIYDKNWYFRTTHQMVRKWLRDTYNLYLFNEYFGESKTYKWRIIEMNSTHKHSDFKHYNIEEEATEASFKYALENLI